MQLEQCKQNITTCMIFGLRSFSSNSLATEDDYSSTARDNGFLHSRGVPNFPSSTFERLDFSICRQQLAPANLRNRMANVYFN